MIQEFIWCGLPGSQILKQGDALRKIDRTTVIRIDETKIPELGALVKVWNAGERDFDQGLRQSVQRAKESNARNEVEKITEEVVFFGWSQNGGHKVRHGRLVRYVGYRPLGMHHRLSNRFDHVVLDSLLKAFPIRRFEWPRAQQCLVEQNLFVPCGDRPTHDYRPMGLV